MNAIVRNIKMFETRRGIAWSADIVTDDGGIIKAENNGNGGCTFFYGDRAMLASLEEWAKMVIPSIAEPLGMLVCYADENETLLQGLEKFRNDFSTSMSQQGESQ